MNIQQWTIASALILSATAPANSQSKAPVNLQQQYKITKSKGFTFVNYAPAVKKYADAIKDVKDADQAFNIFVQHFLPKKEGGPTLNWYLTAAADIGDQKNYSLEDRDAALAKLKGAFKKRFAVYSKDLDKLVSSFEGFETEYIASLEALDQQFGTNHLSTMTSEHQPVIFVYPGVHGWSGAEVPKDLLPEMIKPLVTGETLWVSTAVLDASQEHPKVIKNYAQENYALFFWDETPIELVQRDGKLVQTSIHYNAIFYSKYYYFRSLILDMDEEIFQEKLRTESIGNQYDWANIFLLEIKGFMNLVRHLSHQLDAEKISSNDFNQRIGQKWGEFKARWFYFSSDRDPEQVYPPRAMGRWLSYLVIKKYADTHTRKETIDWINHPIENNFVEYFDKAIQEIAEIL